jgi:hypothetical protein
LTKSASSLFGFDRLLDLADAAAWSSPHLRLPRRECVRRPHVVW